MKFFASSSQFLRCELTTLINTASILCFSFLLTGILCFSFLLTGVLESFVEDSAALESALNGKPEPCEKYRCQHLNS